jgi:hypothetical protein
VRVAILPNRNANVITLRKGRVGPAAGARHGSRRLGPRHGRQNFQAGTQNIEGAGLIGNAPVANVHPTDAGFDHVVQAFVNHVATEPKLGHQGRGGAAKVVRRPSTAGQ